MHILIPRRWNNSLGASLAVFASLLFAPRVGAEDAATEIVLRDLARPCGLVARPGGTADRFELFIAESGAGRILRWSNLKPDQSRPIVSGFSVKSSERGDLQSGPRGMVFLDPGLIAVGVAVGEGQGRILIYEVPEHDELLSAGQPRESTTLLGQHSGCVALARTRANEFVPDLLIAVVRSEKQYSLQKTRVQAGTLGPLERFDAPSPTPQPAFSTVATSPTGHVVAVRRSDGTVPAQLVFYNPLNGAEELALPLELDEVVALAFNPSNGNLYAADFATGIHRINDTSQLGRPACRATRVAEASRPTALAFAPDGSLYVTTLGEATNDGTLQVVTGDL